MPNPDRLNFVVLADFPGVLMRGAVVLVRPAPLVGHLCLGPLAPIQIAVNVAIVSDRNFLFSRKQRTAGAETWFERGQVWVAARLSKSGSSGQHVGFYRRRPEWGL